MIAPQRYLARIAFIRKSYAEGLDFLSDYVRRHPRAPDAERVANTVRNLSARYLAKP